jgi:hypothetical protein
MRVKPKDGKLYAEVTLRDVVERSDVSDLPMLSEIKHLYEENDKLRELLHDYYNASCMICNPWAEEHHCKHDDGESCLLATRAVELGIKEEA